MTVIDAQSRFPTRESDPWPPIRGTYCPPHGPDEDDEPLPWPPYTRDLVWLGLCALVIAGMVQAALWLAAWVGGWAGIMP